MEWYMIFGNAPDSRGNCLVAAMTSSTPVALMSYLTRTLKAVCSGEHYTELEADFYFLRLVSR